MELYLVDVSKPLSKNMEENFISQITQEKHDRIQRLIHKSDFNRGLIGDVLARAVLREKLRIANDQIVFSKNLYGKPYLGNVDHCHFNISHAGKWVACVFDNEPVGVDIEMIKHIDLDIAKRFFTKSEYDYVQKWNDDRKVERFFQLWTLKESYVKAKGEGLTIPLNSFNIVQVSQNMFTVEKNLECKMSQLDIDEDYILSVCSLTGREPERIKHVNYCELLN